METLLRCASIHDRKVMAPLKLDEPSGVAPHEGVYP